MLEKIIKANVKGASIDMYIYPDFEYSIVPLGRSNRNEWIGSRNLDYKIKGNFFENNNNEILNKIIEGLYVSINYEAMNIKANKNNVEYNFIESAKKEGFKKHHKISIVLLNKLKILRATDLTCIDINNDVWVGKRENSIEVSIENIEDLINYFEKIFNK